MLVFQESRLWDGAWNTQHFLGRVLEISTCGGSEDARLSAEREELGCDASADPVGCPLELPQSAEGADLSNLCIDQLLDQLFSSTKMVDDIFWLI